MGTVAPPSVVFVVVICLDFTECFVDDELARVFDVISGINNGRFDLVPIPHVCVEAVCFVPDTASFDTPVLQVVATPRVDV